MEHDAVRQMGIDPKSWEWFNANYSRYRVVDPDPYDSTLVEEKRTGVRPNYLLSSLLFAPFYVVMFTVISEVVCKSMTIALIQTLVFAIGAFMIGSKRQKIVTTGWGIVVGVTLIYEVITHFVGVPIVASLMTTGIQWGAASLLGSLLRRIRQEKSNYVEVPVAFSPTALWNSPEHRVFGRPGGVADAAAKYGQSATDAGVDGEEKTAALLNLLMKIPGTTVYHGLRFPGSKNADVDHAVAHGNNVFLIDSKQWRWGEYEWQCDGSSERDTIVRTDGYGRPRQNHMDAAAEKYVQILGPGINVYSLLIMHGRKVRVGKNSISCKGVAMLTAYDAMRFIGNSIHASMSQWRDNEVVRGELIRSLKP